MTTAPSAPPFGSAPAPEPPRGPAPVPDPPRGPGVHPPFPAPPVEGKGLRIGLGLGIGAAVVLLVCGGGIAATIGLGTSMSGALNEQAHVVVGRYLDAIKAQKYAEAYGMLCQSEKDRQSEGDFLAEQAGHDPIQSYHVGHVDLAAVDLSVPVDVTYTTGQAGALEVYLDQSPDTGQFQVCGVKE
jgi:hypothetical protein